MGALVAESYPYWSVTLLAQHGKTYVIGWLLEARPGAACRAWAHVNRIGWGAALSGAVRRCLSVHAVACPSLIAGEGARIALAQAYVLAGEIDKHGSDLASALRGYEAPVQPYAIRKQRYAESLVPSFVPKTASGVRAREFATLLMRLPVFPRLLIGRYFRDAMKLPGYAMPPVQTQN